LKIALFDEEVIAADFMISQMFLIPFKGGSAELY
jgi:hypothetical protein